MVAACPYPTTQGTQVFIRGMVRALCRRGHEVHLVAYHFGEDLPGEGEILHRIPPLPGYRKLRAGPAWSKPLLDAMLAARLLQVVRRVRPHLVHAHNYEAPIAAYVVRATTGVPVLYHSHNLMADELHLYVRGRIARAMARGAAGLLDRQIPRRADRCVVISEEAVEAHRALGVDPARIHHLPPALHPEDFDGALPDPAGPTVVYAGNPDRYQELHVLLAAMRRVAEALPAARLLVISSADLAEVAALAASVGLDPRCLELHTTSDWAQVQRLMRRGAVAALPRGLCRGFPIKLLNYMAVGLPVVACAGSAKVGRHGQTGLVVPDGDVTAFGEALLELLRSPAKSRRMGERARASILQDHCWERRVAELEEVYRRTAGPDALARDRSLR